MYLGCCGDVWGLLIIGDGPKLIAGMDVVLFAFLFFDVKLKLTLVL